jgi:biopolymer transport protein ExbD
MRRFRSASEGGESSEAQVDMSPLIDCVFILLIFFIVTTTFVEETGVEVDKPRAVSAKMLEKESLMIAITDEGKVIYGGKDIGVGGVQPLVRREMQKAKNSNKKTPVIIQVDDKADAAISVRVVGEAKLGGAEKVSLSTAKS